MMFHRFFLGLSLLAAMALSENNESISTSVAPTPAPPTEAPRTCSETFQSAKEVCEKMMSAQACDMNSTCQEQLQQVSLCYETDWSTDMNMILTEVHNMNAFCSTECKKKVWDIKMVCIDSPAGGEDTMKCDDSCKQMVEELVSMKCADEVIPGGDYESEGVLLNTTVQNLLEWAEMTCDPCMKQVFTMTANACFQNPCTDYCQQLITSTNDTNICPADTMIEGANLTIEEVLTSLQAYSCDPCTMALMAYGLADGDASLCSSMTFICEDWCRDPLRQVAWYCNSDSTYTSSTGEEVRFYNDMMPLFSKLDTCGGSTDSCETVQIPASVARMFKVQKCN